MPRTGDEDLGDGRERGEEPSREGHAFKGVLEEGLPLQGVIKEEEAVGTCRLAHGEELGLKCRQRGDDGKV